MPENPYNRLKRLGNEYWNSIQNRKQIHQWTYSTTQNYNLDCLHQRIQAIEMLGYECILRATDKGIEVWYREKLSPRPWYLY